MSKHDFFFKLCVFLMILILKFFCELGLKAVIEFAIKQLINYTKVYGS